jgi:hypothetical protein
MRGVNDFRLLLLYTATYFILSCASARAVESKAESEHGPLEIQLSQKSEPTPLWIQLVDKLTWPAVIAVCIVSFRKPIFNLLDAFSKRGTDINIGAFAIRLPALESVVEGQTHKLTIQQKAIDLQSAQIENLIRFSMSWYIYSMLFEIRKAQLHNGEYIYREDGSMNRNLRFLIDHGYVEEVYPWPNDGEGLRSRVKITQQGEDLMAMRGPSDGTAAI